MVLQTLFKLEAECDLSVAAGYLSGGFLSCGKTGVSGHIRL